MLATQISSYCIVFIDSISCIVRKWFNPFIIQPFELKGYQTLVSYVTIWADWLRDYRYQSSMHQWHIACTDWSWPITVILDYFEWRYHSNKGLT